jgi:hypothetical protein
MALVAMFVALMVGSGWALAMIPNIEFVTALAFTAGAVLGPKLGMITGACGIFLFSISNPMGSGLAFPVLLAAQVFSETIVGLLGGLFYRVNPHRLGRWFFRLLITVSGFVGTVLYDGLTSISFPLYAQAAFNEVIAVLISGLAFTSIHQISNTLIFFLLVPQLIKLGKRSRRSSGLFERPPKDVTTGRGNSPPTGSSLRQGQVPGHEGLKT